MFSLDFYTLYKCCRCASLKILTRTQRDPFQNLPGMVNDQEKGLALCSCLKTKAVQQYPICFSITGPVTFVLFGLGCIHISGLKLVWTLGPSLFESWHEKGIRVTGDVFEDNILMSFQQLQHKFNLRKHHFCGYLQFSHFMGSLVKPAEDTSLYSGAEKFIHEQMDLNMVISLLLSTLLIHKYDTTKFS